MEKRSKIVLSIISLLVLAVGIEVIAVTHPSQAEQDGRQAATPGATPSSNTIFFQSDRIAVLDACVSSCDLKLTVWDEAKIELTITSARAESDKPYAYLENDTVFIKEDSRTGFSSSDDTSIDIKIPRYLSSNTSVFSIRIETTSGSIKADGLQNKELSINTSSGRIMLDGCKSSSITLNSSSGAIICTETDAEAASAMTQKGTIRWTGSCSKINAKTVSGGITYSAVSVPAKGSEFSSTSGSINIELPEDTGYTLTYETKNGRCKDTIAGTNGKGRGVSVYKDGTAALAVQTVSGNINIDRRH